jgi:hypothetical protein
LAPTDDTGDLGAALERLTGDRGHYARHKKLYRIAVTSSDGKPCAVTVAVTHHRATPAKANLNEIAEGLRIARDQLPTVLRDWSRAELVAHLEQFTGDQLLPLALRRQRGIS